MIHMYIMFWNLWFVCFHNNTKVYDCTKCTITTVHLGYGQAVTVRVNYTLKMRTNFVII